MPRSEEENQRIREAQHARILEAAKEVFARKGWSTTVADVANAAEVSQGLIYHYFASKEEIFKEVMSQIMQSQPLGLQEVLQSEETPTKRLETLITEMLKNRRESMENFQVAFHAANEKPFSDNDFEFMKKMIQNLRSVNTETKHLHKLMSKRFQAARDTIEKLIIEGQAAGEFSQDDSGKLAFMLLASLQSLTHVAIHNPEVFKKYYPYTDILMRMLKPDNTV